jgi:hypothetical protein
MHCQDSSRSRFVLRAVVLGLLALFSVASSLRATESAIAPDTNVSIARVAVSSNAVDLTFTAPIESALPEDFGAALEDSDELLRADIQQRTCGPDRAVIEPKVLARVVPVRHPSISPPLLV